MSEWVRAKDSYIEVRSWAGAVEIRNPAMDRDDFERHVFASEESWAAFKQAVKDGDFDNV